MSTLRGFARRAGDAWKWKPSTQASGLVFGLSVGLISGLSALIVGLVGSPWAFRELPVLTDLFILPALGTGAGYALWRQGRNTRIDDANSISDGPPEVEERRRGRRQRFLAVGLGIGCVSAFLATALDIAWRGWTALGGAAIGNVLLFPYLCVLLALNLSREPGEKMSLRRIRLNLAMLMLLIAYVGVLLGAIVAAQRIGFTAQFYHARHISATSQAAFFRDMARQKLTEGQMRRNNARQLRDGKIPAGTHELQKAFLRSLDSSATPEYRTRNYGSYADAEDRMGQLDEENFLVYGKLADYFEQLSRKYGNAEHRPWEPVTPDPPRP